MEIATAVAVDTTGNVYITGEAGAEGAGGLDVLLVKYEAGSGDWLWTRMWGFSDNEAGTAVAIDAAGHILVAGTTDSLDPALNTDLVLLKYDQAGNLLSSLAWGSPGIDEQCSALSADATGVTLAGSITGTLSEEALVVRFDTGGTQLWARSIGGETTDRGVAVTARPAGGVALAGILDEGGVLPRATLAFFDTGGGLVREQVWTEAPSGLGTLVLDDGMYILGGSAADNSGNWLVGSSEVTVLGDRSLTPAGYSINTPPSSLLFPSGTGSVPVGYVEDSGGGGSDALIIRYIPGSTI